MTDFDLDNSRWYSIMKIGLACRNAKVSAEIIIDRARKLRRYDFDAPVVKELADAETALTEALFALQIARAEYQNQTLQAAE